MLRFAKHLTPAAQALVVDSLEVVTGLSSVARFVHLPINTG